ncbi:hypothetical protein HPB48_013561 [Haemaphysalis longicornis]|uniref:Uncharacterized protein n=1 Tax=Haemaphysalis longicornis TaxID=44386 RepID=A0A9J6GY47_HAELO|nr:hypothetical protein HPB48_013561 [Haemaphysalis longicornis]
MCSQIEETIKFPFECFASKFRFRRFENHPSKNDEMGTEGKQRLFSNKGKGRTGEIGPRSGRAKRGGGSVAVDSYRLWTITVATCDWPEDGGPQQRAFGTVWDVRTRGRGRCDGTSPAFCEEINACARAVRTTECSISSSRPRLASGCISPAFLAAEPFNPQAAMPAKTPKREWSKRPKPKAPTLSLGSSGGACRRLHPSVKDHSVGEDHFEALDEAEIADIVTRAREFLEERGASQEEELFEVLGPRQAQRVQVSFGSLVACLTRQPGFHVICEGECSRVYYRDPKQYDATRTASAQSSLATTPASLVPDSGLLDASSEGSLIEARAVAAVGSGRASPSGSSGSGSYASAMDKQEEERRNACTQTTFDEETLSHWQPRSTRVTCGTQTSPWDSAEGVRGHLRTLHILWMGRAILIREEKCLVSTGGIDFFGHIPVFQEKEVDNGLRSEEQEQQGILSSSSLSGEATVAGACLRNTGVEEGSCQEDSLSVATNEESLLVRAIGSRHEPVALPAKLQGEVLSGGCWLSLSP